MARTFNGIDQFGAGASTFFDYDQPFTICCYIYPTDENNLQYIVGGRRSLGLLRYIGLTLRSDQENSPLSILVNNGSNQFNDHPGKVKFNEWNLIIGTYTGDQTPTTKCYLNTINSGGPLVTAIGALDIIDVFAIGASSNLLDNIGFYSGKIAHIGVWDTVLNAGEMTQLIFGATPDTVKPSSLFDYWALTSGSGLTDVGVNSGVVTWTGSPTQDNIDPIDLQLYTSVEKIHKHFSNYPGLSGGSSDRLDQYLNILGYTDGSLSDRLYSWLSTLYNNNKDLNSLINDWEDSFYQG